MLFPKERIGPRTRPYLIRFHLTPWKWWPFAKRLYLHIFFRPDLDRQMHDHPFPFRSIILWGGYLEEYAVPRSHGKGFELDYIDGRFEMCRRAVHRKWLSSHSVPAEHRHRIISLDKTPTVTLVIRSEKVREWGFYREGQGYQHPKFVPWQQFVGLEPELD